MENVLEVFQSPLVDEEHRLTVALFLLLLGGQLLLVNLDVVLPCQPAQCVGVGQILQLHEEVHRVAAFSAGEAVADAP